MIDLSGATVETSQGGFEARVTTGDDGYPRGDVADVVYVALADGRQFYLPNLRALPVDGEGYGGGYRPRYDAVEMAAKVAARGVIDEAHWVEVDPDDYSLEAALEAAFVDEQEDRRAWGA